jgi:hypothetical protein
MATKSMGYDNPTYVAVGEDQGGAIAAGSGTSQVTKFVAFTALILKSATCRISAAGTSADTMSLVQISGTTTTTTALGTTGSGATGFVNYLIPSTAANMAQGDEYYIQKGTDATLAYAAVSVERTVTPLANVTV